MSRNTTQSDLKLKYVKPRFFELGDFPTACGGEGDCDSGGTATGDCCTGTSALGQEGPANCANGSFNTTCAG